MTETEVKHYHLRMMGRVIVISTVMSIGGILMIYFITELILMLCHNRL